MSQKQLLGRLALGISLTSAACENCTNAGSWKVHSIVSPIKTRETGARSFALDRNGLPGFLWEEVLGPDEDQGIYYHRCARPDCTTASNWTRLKLFGGEASSYNYSLAYDSQGHPRIAVIGPPGRDAAGRSVTTVQYLECTIDCDGQASNWQGPQLFPAGTASDVQLRLDAADRPRLVYHSETTKSGAYAWCDNACLTADGWSGRNLPPRSAAEGIDLAIDAQGRPHISYDTADEPSGLAYATCDENCDRPGSWKAGPIETSTHLDGAHPIPVASGCAGSFWRAGKPSRIAVTPAGRVSIVYEAWHHQGSCGSNPDKMLVRVMTE